jgi:hypothetical protein
MNRLRVFMQLALHVAIGSSKLKCAKENESWSQFMRKVEHKSIGFCFGPTVDRKGCPRCGVLAHMGWSVLARRQHRHPCAGGSLLGLSMQRPHRGACRRRGVDVEAGERRDATRSASTVHSSSVSSRRCVTSSKTTGAAHAHGRQYRFPPATGPGHKVQR